MSTLLEEAEDFLGLLPHQAEPLRHREGLEGCEFEVDLPGLVMGLEFEDPRPLLHSTMIPEIASARSLP